MQGNKSFTYFAAYSVYLSSSTKAVRVFVQVHKFGGTCVAAAERIREAAQLIVDEPAQCKLVVVSAMGSHPSSPVKVTDLLLNMVAKASQQDQAFLIDLAALQARTGRTLMSGVRLVGLVKKSWLEAALGKHTECSSKMQAAALLITANTGTLLNVLTLHRKSFRAATCVWCCRRSMWRLPSCCWARAGS